MKKIKFLLRGRQRSLNEGQGTARDQLAHRLTS